MKLMFSLMVTLILVCTSASNAYAQTNTITKDSIVTTTVKVKGVTCSHDLKTIAANIEELKGVSTVTTGKMGPTSAFEIKYNPSMVTIQQINQAIENTGGCENPNDRPYKVKK